MGWLPLYFGPPRRCCGDGIQVGQDLVRYFPEMAAAAVRLPDRDYVLDGELVIPRKRGFSFDGLLQRIHPAESRIRRLAAETPASFVAFDLLARNGIDLGGMKLIDRRRELEAFAKEGFAKSSTFGCRRRAPNWQTRSDGSGPWAAPTA